MALRGSQVSLSEPEVLLFVALARVFRHQSVQEGRQAADGRRFNLICAQSTITASYPSKTEAKSRLGHYFNFSRLQMEAEKPEEFKTII